MIADQVADRDGAAALGGKARRLAKQAGDWPSRIAYEARRWAEAIAHEVAARVRWIAPEIESAPMGRRAQVVDVGGLTSGPDFRSHADAAATLRLTQGMQPNIATRHEVAHLVVSWAPGREVSDSAAAVTARRYCARIGVDPDEQPVVVALHHDSGCHHMHMLIGRTRLDGGAWVAGLGIDRALALEARAMALEAGQEWDQRMVARSSASGIAAGRAARGQLAGEIRYADGRRNTIAWQGRAVADRIEADPIACAAHGGASIARMVGYRPADRVAAYVMG